MSKEDASLDELRRVFGARDDDTARTASVLRFARERMSEAHRARLPEDAHIEIDREGCAFLCVSGRRLLFSGNLVRLLETLSLDPAWIAEERQEA